MKRLVTTNGWLSCGLSSVVLWSATRIPCSYILPADGLRHTVPFEMGHGEPSHSGDARRVPHHYAYEILRTGEAPI